ncbi:MAG: hypothetical protein AAGH79_15800 [Bacteroidota bacterium]
MKLAQYLLAFGLMTLVACNDEAPTDDKTVKDQLTGRWELIEATRNGQVTETLSSAYMEFLEDGTLATNLAGGREVVNYETDGTVLSIKDGRMPMDYGIETLSESALVLTMSMRDIPFRLSLQKATNVEENTEELQ